MAKKNITDEELVDDLFTKLKKLFKHDLYIINKEYIIGGKASNDELPGYVICRLDIKYIKALFNVYKEEDVLYIADISNKELSPVLDTDYIINIKNTLCNKIDNIDTWNSLIDLLKDDMIKLLMSDNMSIDIDADNNKIILAKSLLPLITLKNIHKVYYHISNGDNISEIIYTYTQDQFTLYVIYNFIN